MSPAPTREILDLTGLLKHTGHVLETRLTAALAGAGLTPRMQCVLVHAMEGERTQIQLADLAHLDKTTMVTTVDGLERAGWAQRRTSTADRRARIIAVTADGERAAAEGQRIVDTVHREVLRDLRGEQRDTFLDVLVGLADGPLATPSTTPTTVRRARG